MSGQVSTITRRVFAGALAAAPLLRGRTARAAETELSIWHDLGAPGTEWLNAAGKSFAETHPGVAIRPISYPTDQWFGRVISAINTDTAPDLVFTNYERVIRVQSETQKIQSMEPVLKGIADRDFLSDEDLRIATYGGRMIILPAQRVLMAFGVRQSWLKATGASYPKTWQEAKEAAQGFQAGDPAGTGKGTAYGFALEAANPRDLITMLDMFTFGAGVRHTLLAPDGKITIDQPDHAPILEAFLRIFTTDPLVAPDTINYSFNEMYQVIEGSRAGMFRVGDWNARKWDTQAIKGDYDVGPWPQFFPAVQSAVVIGGMRGAAVPENSPHKELANAFAASLLTKPAQQASLTLVGDAVRKDLALDGLTEHQKAFARPNWNMIAYDFPESIHPWYPQLEASFHRALMDAIGSPPSDYPAFIQNLAGKMRARATQLAAVAKP